ncbi:MAG: 16S rRNA (cytosine(1402)-N(4))-methyltransferase [Candidatus Peribacteria bacterium]|nr:MAG: 16S rRNA (cytosine(1402)-N(4))-methyltransferase [Candidatus Peribacteria bacterium]
MDVLAKTRVFLETELTNLTIIQGSYAELERIVAESGVAKFDYILLDIGVNMEHFKDANRGFSIKLD